MQSTSFGLVQGWRHLVAEVLFSTFEFARAQREPGYPSGDGNAASVCCASNTPFLKSLAAFLLFPCHIFSSAFVLCVPLFILGKAETQPVT